MRNLVTLFDTTLHRHGSFPLSQSYYIVAGEQANNASLMEEILSIYKRSVTIFFFFFFTRNLFAMICLPCLPSSVPTFSARGLSSCATREL